MPEVMTPATRAPREPRHGVNTPALLATINVVKETPALAKFQFRATNRWISGTYSESRIESFSGAGGEHKHQTDFRYGADHPAVLVGEEKVVALGGVVGLGDGIGRCGHCYRSLLEGSRVRARLVWSMRIWR